MKHVHAYILSVGLASSDKIGLINSITRGTDAEESSGDTPGYII